MKEKGEVTLHEMTDHFIKEIQEKGIRTVYAAKPVNLFPGDGEAFMNGLRYQFSGSYLGATKPYKTT